MRLGILCIGRMKSGPERELFARYAKRIGTMRNLGLDGLDVRELDESPVRDIAARITAEGDALLSVLTPEATVAAFDERGEAASSLDFARFHRARARRRTQNPMVCDRRRGGARSASSRAGAGGV